MDQAYTDETKNRNAINLPFAALAISCGVLNKTPTRSALLSTLSILQQPSRQRLEILQIIRLAIHLNDLLPSVPLPLRLGLALLLLRIVLEPLLGLLRRRPALLLSTALLPRHRQ